jgi:hypothetical protein
MADQELRAEILDVLERAHEGGKGPGFLTAYQILQQLPEARRDALIGKHGTPGKGADTYYSAASRIATAIHSMGDDVVTEYLDPTGVTFDVGVQQYREAGCKCIGLYRKV